MEDFYIKSTSKTPYMNFQISGTFEITGRSIPENSIEFYKPLLEWLDSYSTKKNIPSTNLQVRLEYFNTSSSKCLLEIFKRMELIVRNGISAKITWQYEEEDEDMKELGEDFKEILQIPVELIPVKNY